MAITAGTKLGPYEILSPLGAGGMGEVYRARDTKLNREVALKVLPEAFASDAQRMARFHREAQLLASLNHPNIASIYGLEESSGIRALVMELVEGPTLAERMAGAGGRGSRPSGETGAGGRSSGSSGERRSALPIDETLHFARQIAEALEYAHERGIIHRDLKPANIKVTLEGAVKVLDFGLAKALDAESSPSELQKSPTQALGEGMTGEGAILGTAGYMAPEQARGKAVDRRADIWAFGCVLFEMLTGQRVFKRDSIKETVAAVLGAEVDWRALPAGTPFEISKLLRRCLQKEPRRRLRDIGDARITIEETLSGDVEAGLPRQSEGGGVKPPLQRAFPWAVAAILLITSVFLAIIHLREAPVTVRSVRSYILPPEKTTFAFEWTIGGPVLSPDGRHLAFAARDSSGKEMLWVRELDSLSAQSLEGTQGASLPFWSPDSRSIGYFALGKLMKIDIPGGPAQTICDAPNGHGGTWSANGVIVFAPEVSAGLEQVSAAGGRPTPLVPLDKSNQLTSLRWPAFLPDGRHFIYWAGNPYYAAAQNAAGIYLASLDGMAGEFLFPTDSNALYSAPGYLVFLNADTLMGRPFDAGSLKLTGDAFPVVERVANPAGWRLGHFSVSQQGDLVYETGEQIQDQVVWMDASGKQLDAVGLPGIISDIRLSPDGRTLAEEVQDQQSRNYDLWLVDLVRGVRTRFTFNPAIDGYPAWSPDGTKIAFSSSRSGATFDIYVKPTSGTGTTQPLVEDGAAKYVTDWSKDGRYIAYMRRVRPGKAGWDIWVVPLLGDKKPFPFLKSEFDERDASFSPDGKSLAYTSDESGKREVYVVPFPQGNGKSQVSTVGGTQPRWRRDGKELFYLSGDNKLMAVGVEGKNGSLEIGNPQTLFQGTSFLSSVPWSAAGSYDVTADGKKFVVLIQAAQSGTQPITLVTNWTAGLKK